ncbi:hypothetical protein MUN78_04545 [Leucobacter allii]|uniref:Helix-turn-helix domain-containing protein n=1 Tax=Leucobacter allii TaxID=2932247 RepID=A0ABY4FPA9_9MICO|nr:hypothetical protein [Leucobacter allii]UOQ58121.1 hypothetical protein MUN78_04545 [Leucobacter allii]
MAEGFAAIPTWMIRDPKVSATAIMVFGSLASRGGLEAVIPSRATIALEARCSVRSVSYALTELENLGVVERLERISDGGARLSSEYVLSNRPRAHAAQGVGTECRAPVQEATSVPLIEVDSSEVDTCASAHAQSAHSFEDWWKAYPLKKDKGRARTAYRTALKKTSHEVLVAAAIAYRDDPNRVQAFTKYPASWLNAEAWDNGPLPQRAAPGGTAVERMEARLRGLGAEGVQRELGA